MSTIRVGLVQVHPVVGDIEGNARRIGERLQEAADAGCELAVCGELALCGYPPQSLIVDEAMLDAIAVALQQLADDLPPGLVAIIGAPHPTEDGRGVVNAAAVLTKNQVAGWADKQHLPTYAIFDEGRYFVPSRDATVVELPTARVGVMICADLWEPEPSTACASAGADLLVALNASPYSPWMQRKRQATTSARAMEHTVPVIYVNLVGGQDGLVFDGGSHAVDQTGTMVARAPALEEAVLAVDIDVSWSRRSARAEPHRRAAARPSAGPVRMLPVRTTADPDLPTWSRADAERAEIDPEDDRRAGIGTWPDEEQIRWRAACRALDDFASALDWKRVMVGLDGTLGAGLTALIALEALGADRVLLVDLLPATVDDGDERRAWSRAVVTAAGTGALAYAPPPVHVTPEEGDADALPEPAVPDEDPASRLLASRTSRLALLLLSDQHEALVLSTADRTMRALGGGWPHEVQGAFAPLGDLTRGWLVRIARWLEARTPGDGVGPVTAPPEIMRRAEETLGGTDPMQEPCAVLDQVVEHYIDANHPPDVIAAMDGLERGLVLELCARIEAAEHGRRTLPIAPRMSGRALSDDRRMPVAWRRGW